MSAFISTSMPIKRRAATSTATCVAAGAGASVMAATPAGVTSHPYSSWERGTNENTNGLVRQYFPKKTDFSLLSDEDVQRVADRLNNRPRKTLGFRTPYEVFYNKSVALIT